MFKLPPAACSPFEGNGPQSADSRVAPYVLRKDHRRNGNRGERDEGERLLGALDARDVLLTRQETADYLRKSTATLERWARDGFGPQPVMVGRRALYRLTDLRAFIGADAEAA